MADRESIRRTLVDFFEAETAEKIPALDDDKNLREELWLDSVDVVSIVMQIERHYRIRLAHQELEKLVHVGQLIDLIESKLAASAETPAA